ncbi:MAG: hypothetical protein EXS36_05935 [Pedosphaera sp.]|nr:hypothetical protein [Pedosphaera sp.]
MKSAFELAMERLSQGAPTKTLTAAQKKKLAEIDSICRAKTAEKELGMQDEMAAARAAGDGEKLQKIRSGFAVEKEKLEADRDAKKARVRGDKAN